MCSATAAENSEGLRGVHNRCGLRGAGWRANGSVPFVMTTMGCHKLDSWIDRCHLGGNFLMSGTFIINKDVLKNLPNHHQCVLLSNPKK